MAFMLRRMARWMKAAALRANAFLSSMIKRGTNVADSSMEAGAVTPDQQERKVNAPLDPFGRSPDALDLAGTFSFLRASFVAGTDGALKKFDDLVSIAQQSFFRPDEPPSAVLFVSHRWETPAHPDPHGRQADCLRKFLKTVDDIVRTTPLSAEERGACVPSLLAHGPFQAAYFVDNGIAFGVPEQRWHEHWNSRAQNLGTTVRKSVLDHVGVWYDYACLPQEAPGSQRLADSLLRIHELIGECTMLVLRYPGDDYECRSWCASELAIEPNIERRACRKIVLRLDKLGEEIAMGELTREDRPDANTGSRKILSQPIGEWPKYAARSLAGVTQVYDMFLPELEDRETPLLTPRQKPNIFEGQRTLQVRMIQTLSEASGRDELLAGNMARSLNLDMTSVVEAAMAEAGLRCTDPKDQIYTGLLILYARHRGYPELASLFAECLKRWLARTSNVLARYRENREPYNERAWYVFADEPAASGAWKLPDWAR
jgi:hypothetical protein